MEPVIREIENPMWRLAIIHFFALVVLACGTEPGEEATWDVSGQYEMVVDMWVQDSIIPCPFFQGCSRGPTVGGHLCRGTMTLWAGNAGDFAGDLVIDPTECSGSTDIDSVRGNLVLPPTSGAITEGRIDSLQGSPEIGVDGWARFKWHGGTRSSLESLTGCTIEDPWVRWEMFVQIGDSRVFGESGDGILVGYAFPLTARGQHYKGDSVPTSNFAHAIALTPVKCGTTEGELILYIFGLRGSSP